MIRIKVRGPDGDVIKTLLLEDRSDVGPEIRDHHAPDAEAGRSVTVDIEVGRHADTMGERLGLKFDEIDRLTRWREAAGLTPAKRVEQGMTPADMGRILDTLAERLDADAYDDEQDLHRIVIEVEPTP